MVQTWFMKITFLLSISIALFSFTLRAGGISCMVTDDKCNLLPYASILVKGTAIGATANSEGRYSLQLSAGRYIIVCQYVGYERQEKPVTIANGNEVLNFRLSLQQTAMKEVI